MTVNNKNVKTDAEHQPAATGAGTNQAPLAEILAMQQQIKELNDKIKKLEDQLSKLEKPPADN